MDHKRDHIIALWRKVCVDNDVKAFESLYYLLYDVLVKFCMMYIQKREEAEEIVGDVFVKSWMNRESMLHVERPDTYLFVAVKNQSLNYLKKYSSIHVVATANENDVNLIDTSNPQVQLEKKELQIYLDQSIDTLPQQCRIVFKLIKEDGLMYKEVAEILNISPRTVQTQLFRAIQKLSVCLSGYVGQPSRRVMIQEKVVNMAMLLTFSEIFFFSL